MFIHNEKEKSDKMGSHKKVIRYTLCLIIAYGFITSFDQLKFTVQATSAQEMEKRTLEEYNRNNEYMIDVKENGSVEHVKVDDLPAYDEVDTYSNPTYDVVRMLDDGDIVTLGSYSTYEEAMAVYQREIQTRQMLGGRSAIVTNGQIRAIENGVVNLRGKITSCSAYVTYTEEGTNYSGYTNGCYGADAAYLGTNADGSKVKFKIAGVVGWANAKDVSIMHEKDAYVSYYRVSDKGYLYHYVRTNATGSGYTPANMVGYQPSYLEKGKIYFSYDGHYFYTDFVTMLNDYKNGVYTHAINANDPYYNYYQYLSFRSKTDFSADDLNRRVADEVSGASAMKNTGNDFVNNQNTYGTNALLMFGVGANESAWGTSYYALNKNNLFGLNAHDSNPDDAFKFHTVGDGIKQFSKIHISEGYLDPKDGFGRYFGPHLGDKASGLNVKYASDPYWGEKAAAQAYYTEIFTGKKYSGDYRLGVINSKHTALNVRKEPTSSSTLLYATSKASNFPFVILAETTGPSVNGNNVWYKIQTDAPLTSNRNAIVQDNGVYDFQNNYAYVSAYYVSIISKGSGNTSSGGGSNEENKPSYLKGDVNGDGKVSFLDYVAIENHIMDRKKLSGDSLKRADVNGDGKISFLDYVAIENHIMGRKPLF